MNVTNNLQIQSRNLILSDRICTTLVEKYHIGVNTIIEEIKKERIQVERRAKNIPSSRIGTFSIFRRIRLMRKTF